jgi:hypothetical protein
LPGPQETIRLGKIRISSGANKVAYSKYSVFPLDKAFPLCYTPVRIDLWGKFWYGDTV